MSKIVVPRIGVRTTGSTKISVKFRYNLTLEDSCALNTLIFHIGISQPFHSLTYRTVSVPCTSVFVSSGDAMQRVSIMNIHCSTSNATDIPLSILYSERGFLVLETLLYFNGM